MSKPQMRITKGYADKAGGTLGWGSIISACGFLLLTGIAWIIYSWIPQIQNRTLALGFGLLALNMAVAMAGERLLTYTPVSSKWCYRGAFGYSVGLYFVHELFLASEFHQRTLVILPASVVLGAFLGGVLASGFHERFWENNSPPTVPIQAETWRIHASRIGALPPEPLLKRTFDLFLALGGLVLSAPVWLLSGFFIWIEDPGPILFVKNSVGKGGRNFHQLKFRTMICGAEIHTGPVLAQRHDERVLLIGRFLRKTALDELPQLVNILRGEMSFVGPRPQRTVLVRGYLERIPGYAERHKVLPGLAGLAQVAGDYYLTPLQKLRYDRLYIRNRSLGFDLKLIILACLITFWFRWRKDWSGKLPRGLIHYSARRG